MVDLSPQNGLPVINCVKAVALRQPMFQRIGDRRLDVAERSIAAMKHSLEPRLAGAMTLVFNPFPVRVTEISA